jgi:hypothetical protein
MIGVQVLIILFQLAGCRSGAGPEHGPGEKNGGDAVTTEADQIELRWRRHRLADLGLELDVLDGPEVSEGSAGATRYAIQEDRGVKLRVAAGAGGDLASWRGSYAARSPRFWRESATTLCGGLAHRQEAEVAAESATGSFAGSDGAIGHMDVNRPAVHAVAVAFTIAGQPVLVEWVVPAADRERYRDAERRFLGSITCGPKGGT